LDSVQLYAIEDKGPIQLPLPAQGRTIHDLFDDLPIGIYTALRTFEHQKILHLEDHLERLDQSMALLGWDYWLNRSRLREALHQITTNYPLPDARVRIDVLTRSIPSLGTSDRELIALSPFEPIPESFYRQGVRVDLVEQLNRQQPLVKKADFVLKRRKFLAESPQAYERLMADDQGNILEGTTSNFFAVCDGCLWTAGQEVLEGIARKIVLYVTVELQLPVRLEPVSIEELPHLDEAALSSSSRAIIPIIQVGEQIIGSGRPGPITAQLLAAYNAYVKRAIRPAVA
jgi:branched-chain amino acid aminotransferase